LFFFAGMILFPVQLSHCTPSSMQENPRLGNMESIAVCPADLWRG